MSLNWEAQHLKEPRTITAPVQFSQSQRAAVVAPAMLVGLMSNDEEAAAWTEHVQREREAARVHLNACKVVQPYETCRTTGMFRDKWAVPGVWASPDSSLGIFWWHFWGTLHLTQWFPGTGGYKFCFGFGLSTALPHRFPACPLPTCQQLRGVPTTSSGTW